MAQGVTLHSTEVGANTKVITVKGISLDKGSGTNVFLQCDAADIYVHGPYVQTFTQLRIEM